MNERKIKSLRKQLKWSQGEMATAIGVSQATVSNWESGNIGMSWANAKKAASIASTHELEAFDAQAFMDDCHSTQYQLETSRA